MGKVLPCRRDRIARDIADHDISGGECRQDVAADRIAEAVRPPGQRETAIAEPFGKALFTEFGMLFMRGGRPGDAAAGKAEARFRR